MSASMKTKLAKLVEQKAKIETEIAALTAALASIVDTATLNTGDTVTFKAGKPESEQTGLVIGVKRDAEGDLFRVAIGSGFDAVTVTVKAQKVVKIVKAQ